MIRHATTKYGKIFIRSWSRPGTFLMASLLGGSLSAAWSILSLKSSFFSESQRLRMYHRKRS